MSSIRYSLHKMVFSFVVVFTLTIAAGSVFTAQAEQLNVGSTSTGKPFTFLDIKTKKISGFMVDLIDAIGQKAGFTPDVRTVPFSSLIPALESKRIDIISAAMIKTPNRAKKIAFSDPVYPYNDGMVVKKDNNTKYSRSLAETQGEVIGVQQGTTYYEGLSKMDGIGKIRVYNSLADILREVERGRIVAGIGDKPIIAYQMSQGKYSNLKFADGYKPHFGGLICIGVRKGDQNLLSRINKAITELKNEGEIDRLAKKWGIKS